MQTSLVMSCNIKKLDWTKFTKKQLEQARNTPAK